MPNSISPAPLTGPPLGNALLHPDASLVNSNSNSPSQPLPQPDSAQAEAAASPVASGLWARPERLVDRRRARADDSNSDSATIETKFPNAADSNLNRDGDGSVTEPPLAPREFPMPRERRVQTRPQYEQPEPLPEPIPAF